MHILLHNSFTILEHYLILPCIEYCSPVWSSAVDSYLKLLDKYLNAVKFLIPDLCNNLWYWHSISSLCMLYKIYHKSKHPMHSDLPSLYHPPDNTRNAVNSNSLAFSLVRVNTTRFSRSIISSVTIGYGMIYPATSLNLWKFRITQWILIISRWTDLGCMRPGPYANCYILFVLA